MSRSKQKELLAKLEGSQLEVLELPAGAYCPIPQQITPEEFITRNWMLRDILKKLKEGEKILSLREAFSTNSLYGFLSIQGIKVYVRIADHPGRRDLPGFALRKARKEAEKRFYSSLIISTG